MAAYRESKHRDADGKGGFLCPIGICENVQKHRDQVLAYHIKKQHPNWDRKRLWNNLEINDLSASQLDAWKNGHFILPFPKIDESPLDISLDLHISELKMDEVESRPKREPKPTSKVKEASGMKDFLVNVDPDRMLPVVYVADLVKASSDVKEVEKIYDHTKISPSGQKTEFYSLGSHLENKDKRCYVRAKQDPNTMYFHTTETAPYYARLSDEGHNLCAADKVQNGFTKDMLSTTGESGHHNKKANVCAREGQFFWEAKILSITPNSEEKLDPGVPLITGQEQDRTKTTRGTLRLGFSRREHPTTLNAGDTFYSYAISMNLNSYGSGKHGREFVTIDGKEYDCPKVGDVIGLMITLPPLEVHDKVVKGTFKSADYPGLKCGFANPMKGKKSAAGKKGAKMAPKPKDKGKEKAVEKPGTEVDLLVAMRAEKRAQFNAEHGLTTPAILDIVRDRNPFLFKAGLVYFEGPEYTMRSDLMHSGSLRNANLDPETGKRYNLREDPHPNHDIPHLRTLPGSKIEVWVNGEYHGLLFEHLFAFLPPASFIEKSAKATQLWGNVDDGMLGYFPTVGHYGGGAVECKFDGPWWYGYDKEKYPDCRDMGSRYKEQIIEDMVSDMVDEAMFESFYEDKDWYKKMIATSAANTRPVQAPVQIPIASVPAGMGIFTGTGMTNLGSSSK